MIVTIILIDCQVKVILIIHKVIQEVLLQYTPETIINKTKKITLMNMKYLVLNKAKEFTIIKIITLQWLEHVQIMIGIKIKINTTLNKLLSKVKIFLIIMIQIRVKIIIKICQEDLEEI